MVQIKILIHRQMIVSMSLAQAGKDVKNDFFKLMSKIKGV